MVEYYQVLLVVVAAFWLGACPFSVWVGHKFLGKEVRDYGDGNPGAANVMRAGGRKSFGLAMFLDMAKGVPFVYLAHAFWGFPDMVVVVVGLSAIMGHAFSPFLGFKGGKSIAVTGGVLLALPHPGILFSFIVFLLIAFIFIEKDAWIVIAGATGALAYLVVTRGNSWESLFMLGVLVILAVKHFNDLKTVPTRRVRILAWLQSRRR
ncbi:MAG: glycerol-3-phosphate acyltransferase [Deltaproteobacteria bacterium]|nr:glycerol-3-phosphate acyltransferase [Deltaproteobacteria bacterium]